jgi:MMP 1-O-methyltransferase
MKGGYLVFHDIFLDPSQGVQTPYQVYQQALASGLYEVLPLFKSLGIYKNIV